MISRGPVVELLLMILRERRSVDKFVSSAGPSEAHVKPSQIELLRRDVVVLHDTLLLLGGTSEHLVEMKHPEPVGGD